MFIQEQSDIVSPLFVICYSDKHILIKVTW